MQIVVILTISVSVLLALRMLPGEIGKLAGSHPMTAAVLLPLVATYGTWFVLFAVCAVVLMIYAPAIGRAGLVVPPADAIDPRARLFLFCLPMMPILTCTVAISGLTVIQLNFMILLAVGHALAMRRAGARMRIAELARWDLLFALMLTAQIVMYARGNDPAFWIRTVAVLVLGLGLPYLAVSRACRRSPRPDRLLLSLVVAGCILGAITTFESTFRWLLYHEMPYWIGADPTLMNGYTKQRGGLLRGRATWGESTGLSLLFGVQLVILFALRRQVGSRYACYAMGLVLTAGLVFTFARVGYIVAAVGLLACLVHERRWRGVFGFAAALPVGFVALSAIGSIVPAVRASLGIGGDAAGSVDYRSQLLEVGTGIFREHWLIGQDLAGILFKLTSLKQGEGIVDLVNEPLTILMMGGVVGASAYFAMFACVCAALFARGPGLDDRARAVGAASFASLLGLMASLATTSIGRNDVTLAVLLGAGAGVLSRRATSRRPAAIVPHVIDPSPSPAYGRASAA